MENNENLKTNMMDLLPNEMIINIFEYIEDLDDLLTLPKVNQRFKVLSSLKCSRNNLVIKDAELNSDSFLEFKLKMDYEISKCRDLKTLTYKVSDQNMELAFCNFIPCWLLNKLRIDGEDVIDGDDIGGININSDGFHLFSFIKKKADNMYDVVRMAPSHIKYILANGTPKQFQTAVEKSTDTLEVADYRGTNITLANLNALGKCKKLEKVFLRGKLEVTEEVPNSFPTIQAEEIYLQGNFSCPYVADLFFSGKLEIFSTFHSTIVGFGNQLLTKCTKLKRIIIDMESERMDVQNYNLINSIIDLVNILKHHETLEEISIKNLDEEISMSLSDPLSECLESIEGSGFRLGLGRSFGINMVNIRFNRII